jgi:hypothetical protein
MTTKHIIRKAPLELRTRVFKVCLIVLDGQGIDVILGMGWMRRHKVILDTTARVVHLESLVHSSTALQLSLSPVTPSSVQHTVAQNLKDIPVAYKFLDVFPEDFHTHSYRGFGIV